MEESNFYTKFNAISKQNRVEAQKLFTLLSSRSGLDNNSDLDVFENHSISQRGLHFTDKDFDCFVSNGDADHKLPRDSILLRFDPLLTPASSIKNEKSNNSKFGVSENNNFECTEKQGELLSNTSSKNRASNKSEKDSIDSAILCDNRNFAKNFSEPQNEEITFSNSYTFTMMTDLEKKNRNDLLRLDELEKKSGEETARRIEIEQREEQLLKKIADKDKAFLKLQNVVAEYEKAISEMITEKENILQQSELKLKQLRDDSDANAQHLTSLEATFSDLHIKYERTKQVAAELKEREMTLTAEKKALEENLRMQEQRYEKMKNHAVMQLENANAKLEEQNRNHQLEVTKLKALLKKEEISRASIQEQLLQKSKENEELVKICDELINGGGTN